MRYLKEFASSIYAAFQKRNPRKLRKINDEILVAAAVNFSQAFFQLAIFSYVLSKIVSKPRMLRDECAPCLVEIEKTLMKLEQRAEIAEESELLGIFSQLGKIIAHLEKKDPRFVIDLVTKGKLKMAATLYAQGMSLGVAAERTGMEKHEILDYAGETMMFERVKEEKAINERIKFARKLIEE